MIQEPPNINDLLGIAPAFQELLNESRIRCACDFCAGRKKWDDNWCSYCATVKMEPPKWWENLDLCDACEKLHREDPEKFWGGR